MAYYSAEPSHVWDHETVEQACVHAATAVSMWDEKKHAVRYIGIIWVTPTLHPPPLKGNISYFFIFVQKVLLILLITIFVSFTCRNAEVYNLRCILACIYFRIWPCCHLVTYSNCIILLFFLFFKILFYYVVDFYKLTLQFPCFKSYSLCNKMC